MWVYSPHKHTFNVYVSIQSLYATFFLSIRHFAPVSVSASGMSSSYINIDLEFKATKPMFFYVLFTAIYSS